MLQDLAVIFEDAGSSIVMKDTPAVESISFNDIPSRIILKPDVFLPDALDDDAHHDRRDQHGSRNGDPGGGGEGG